MVRWHRVVASAVALLGGLGLAGCGGSDNGNITSPPPGDPPPAGDALALEPAFEALSFTAPLGLLQAPGDASRWFVVTQGGVVHVFDNRPDVATGSVFADLSAIVDASASESGLLGMAFHPDFWRNGEVYLSYTRPNTTAGSPFDSIVSRFTVAAGGQSLDLATEEVILQVPQDAANHNGGHIVFGPDRLLYAGFGDGGGSGDPQNRGQTTSNVLGSIVRIDVDGVPPYQIPPGNPFANNTECMMGFGNAPCPEIFAYGLRNPWRFSFDRVSGVLWAGDVGQNRWEEIDRIEKGMNYGWREREGAHCFDPATGCSMQNVDPVAEYGHDVGQSVTGGYVYRGSDYPSLAGAYVFADFISGRVFTIPADSPLGTVPEERLATGLNISSFGEANDGELYLLDYAGGTIHRVVAAP